jgi:thiazole synthase ThiGH ThiG subunit
MLKRALTVGGTSRLLLVDSITLLDAADSGAIVVSASHGGVSSAAFALEHPLAAVFFNDAGVGKDDAGIAALALLDARGVPAGTVAHTSARIGDAQDTWDHGVISHLNAAALRWGLRTGVPLRLALEGLDPSGLINRA